MGIAGAVVASLVMHPLVSIVHGLDAASAANETAKDETVNASSVSNLHYESGYSCYLPLNCYAGHDADEIDYVGDVASISACAEAYTALSQCEGFVYMGTQQKCWRRRNINPAACERGEWNTEQRVHHVLVRGLVSVFILRRCICMVVFSHKLASMIRVWRQVTRAPLPCTAISCRRYVESASVDDV